MSGETRAYISGPYFRIAIKPRSLELKQGKSASLNIRVYTTTGYNKSVSLDVKGVPKGISISFTPSTGYPNFTSVMTIEVSSDSAPGVYTITITGIGKNGKSWTSQLTLTVKERLPVLEWYIAVGAIIATIGTAFLLCAHRMRKEIKTKIW